MILDFLYDWKIINAQTRFTTYNFFDKMHFGKVSIDMEELFYWKKFYEEKQAAENPSQTLSNYQL